MGRRTRQSFRAITFSQPPRAVTFLYSMCRSSSLPPTLGTFSAMPNSSWTCLRLAAKHSGSETTCKARMDVVGPLQQVLFYCLNPERCSVPPLCGCTLQEGTLQADCAVVAQTDQMENASAAAIAAVAVANAAEVAAAAAFAAVEGSAGVSAAGGKAGGAAATGARPSLPELSGVLHVGQRPSCPGWSHFAYGAAWLAGLHTT